MLGTFILAEEILHPLVPTATLVLPTLPHFCVGVAARVVGKLLGVDKRVSLLGNYCVTLCSMQTLQRWHAAMWNFYQRHVLFVFENASGQQVCCAFSSVFMQSRTYRS